MERSKAFFLNGGAGRKLCSIPALEKYEQESNDKDFIIVCEGGTEMLKGHPTLDYRTYDHWHKNLFKEKIKDKDIVTVEPYRVWEYYNQKCNISQAVDIQINNKGIRPLAKPTFVLSKEELLTGRQVVSDIKKKLNKTKLLIIQPFGRGIQYSDETFFDPSGRSIEYSDLKKLITKFQEKNYAIIIMSEYQFDFTKDKFKDDIVILQNINLRKWAAIIKYCDHFFGCDSVGQHLAYAVDTLASVVIGSTFPINVSYPENKNFNIFDLGEHDREFSPIRICQDERIDRQSEKIMMMTPEIIDYIINAVIRKKTK